jgi:hypothetical protein
MQSVLGLLLLLALTLQAPPATDARTDQLATLINQARVAHGQLPLARSASLDAAAGLHSRDMVAHNYLDHTGSDNSTPQERADQGGYSLPRDGGGLVVEVISAISDQPDGPLHWWLDESPAVHGKVLLDARWRDMGVGYAAGGEFGNYWTVLVGCREQCADGSATGPAVSVRQTGENLEVQWTGITAPTAEDWLGLYQPGGSEYQAWAYVSCASMPLVPRAGGWCSWRVPPDIPSGTYEVRLLARDSYERLATSAPLVVRQDRNALGSAVR